MGAAETELRRRWELKPAGPTTCARARQAWRGETTPGRIEDDEPVRAGRAALHRHRGSAARALDRGDGETAIDYAERFCAYGVDDQADAFARDL